MTLKTLIAVSDYGLYLVGAIAAFALVGFGFLVGFGVGLKV